MANLEICQKRCLLADRTAHLPLQSESAPRRLFGHKRIARIENIAAVMGLDLAVKILAAGFRKYLDPPHADAIVLRRKRILVDPNLADRRLGWQTPPGETIDVDLAAVRARR